MEYSKQICTKIISADSVREQLRSLLSRIKNHGFSEVEILFGFAWGNEIYPDPQWEYDTLPIEQVEPRVKKEEANKSGKLGDDDFYIQLSGIPLEIQLCHESDLHLWFEEKSPLVEEIFSEWKALGFEPKEYIKENEKWIPSIELTRDNT